MRTDTFGTILLLAGSAFARPRLVTRNATSDYPPASAPSKGTRYAIMDNDWGSTAFITFLLALGGDMKILSLASNTANSWVDQTTLHAVNPLEDKKQYRANATPARSP